MRRLAVALIVAALAADGALAVASGGHPVVEGIQGTKRRAALSTHLQVTQVEYRLLLSRGVVKPDR